MSVENSVVMEGVQIIFRNFSGKPGKYNEDGQRRSFGVLLDDTVANAMSEDGWNVKWLKPREDDEGEENQQAFLSVTVKYSEKARPPRVVMITSRGRTNLDEDGIDMLDWADITNVDLIVRPYNWDLGDKKGVTAYLQSIYVTIEEDVLEQKYADLDAQQTSEGD